MQNRAAIDVQAHLQAQGTALQQYTKAFPSTRAAVRVHSFALFLFLQPSMGARHCTHLV